MKVIVDEKKIIFEAEKDEHLALAEISTGEILVWHVKNAGNKNAYVKERSHAPQG